MTDQPERPGSSSDDEARPSAPEPPQPPDPYAPPADPYGTPPPAGSAPPQYGAQPQYGPPPYGTPPPGYGPAYGGAYAPPPPLSPEQQAMRTQALTALIVNIVIVVFSCFAALPSIGGAVTAGVALGQVQTDPENARRMIRWSWGLLIASVVIFLLLVVGFIVLVIAAGVSSS